MIITTPFLVCLLGLILWLIFAKTKLSDPWMARVGELCFFAGLLAWLFSVAGKTIF